MKKEGKILPFPLIHHEEHLEFDPIESRLHHLNHLVSQLPVDSESFLWNVQEKLAEAIFWYGEYLDCFSIDQDD